MLSTTFKLDYHDDDVRQVLADALNTLRSGATGPMRDEFRRAAARYLGFIRRRFVNASRGDGTWLPLARSTKLARLRKINPTRLRQLVKPLAHLSRADQINELLNSRPFPILRDRNTLFASLTEGSPGNVLEYRTDGVVVGSSVFYARFHQDPPQPGRPPQRLIFVDPDGPTMALIVNELALGVVHAFLEDQERSNSADQGYFHEGAD